MRTVSFREPIVRALLSSKIAVVGRNVPVNWTPATLKNQLGPIGIHVSKQGSTKELHRMREVATKVMKLTNMGLQDAPFGHVVARARVVALTYGRFPASEVVSYTLASLLEAGVDVPRRLVNRWLLMNPSVEPKFWWVIALPKPCKPVPWKGVMGQFPVPDEVFDALPDC